MTDFFIGTKRISLKTGGGALMASGVGVPIGLGLSAIGTIWDWLD